VFVSTAQFAIFRDQLVEVWDNASRMMVLETYIPKAELRVLLESMDNIV
jgi:hypothetical protein